MQPPEHRTSTDCNRRSARSPRKTVSSPRIVGYSRQQFYEIRRSFQLHGADGLIDRLPGARGPHLNRVPAPVEEAIPAHALEHPTHGAQRVADELMLRRIQVSSGGMGSTVVRSPSMAPATRLGPHRGPASARPSRRVKRRFTFNTRSNRPQGKRRGGPMTIVVASTSHGDRPMPFEWDVVGWIAGGFVWDVVKRAYRAATAKLQRRRGSRGTDPTNWVGQEKVIKPDREVLTAVGQPGYPGQRLAEECDDILLKYMA